MSDQKCNCLIVKPQKSLMAAIILSLFLGPIGLLYAGFWSGLIMTVLMITSVFVPKVGFLLLILLWIVGPYWSVFVCTKDNKF